MGNIHASQQSIRLNSPKAEIKDRRSSLHQSDGFAKDFYSSVWLKQYTGKLIYNT
jgi:hypothetical protein